MFCVLVAMVSGEIERVGDLPLRRVLSYLGGWPVIETSWNSSAFTLEKVLGIMRGHYNAAMMIDSGVAADDKNSTEYILQVSLICVLARLVPSR